MKKIIIIPIILIVVILLILAFVRQPLLDRVNPLLSMEWDYAKVPKDTQDYNDITVYDKNGEKLGYKLDFIGNNPGGEYVKIEYKGKYVKFIDYIDKSEFPKKAR